MILDWKLAMTRSRGLILAVALSLSGAVLAQHSFTPEEVETGGRLYLSNCSSCHGTSGYAITGAELMTGEFHRATSDDDLVALIRNGIPNTAMKADRDLTDTQAAMVIAYLRSVAISRKTPATTPVPELPAGDATRGKALFEGAKGNCLSCHRVGGNGSRFGPDLSAIGVARGGGARGGAAPGANPQTLAQKLLAPNATMTAANRYVRLVEKSGNVVTGKLLNEDTFTIQVFDSKEKLATYSKSNMKEVGYASPMPSYREKLNPQELSDVVTYLISLKGN